MQETEITHCSAQEIAALIGSGGVSARETADAHIAAIEAVNLKLNAVVVRRFAAARAEADAVDAQRRRGEKLPPLAGVPVTIKEALDVEGLPSTGGLPSRAGHCATHDAEAVARLRQAGAIVLAKTNVAQLLLFIESDNPLYGRVNNPWNIERSAGGSSGGEGAIVAAGGSALGIGTDIGGSVRVPAAVCGIAGIKPTAGRIPDPQRLSVPVGAGITSQIGPLARRVGDVALGLQAINDARIALADWRAVDVSKLRVGVYEEDGLFAPAPAVRRAVREAAGALQRAGATVVPWRIPEPDQANALYYGLLSADGGAGLKRLLGADQRDPRVAQQMFLAARSAFTRKVLGTLAGAFGQKHLAKLLPSFGGVSVDQYWRMCEARDDYIARFRQAMDRAEGGALDLLLGPVVAVPALTHGAAKDLGIPGIYTALYNLTGHPAGVVPVTRVRAGEEGDRPASGDLAEKAARKVESGSAGLPVGAQVIARHWQEHVALAAMAAIEAAVQNEKDYPATPRTPA